MTAAQQFWMTDGTDTHALVTSVAERDRWAAQFWREVEEPTVGSVFIWRSGIEQPGRVSVEAFRVLWAPRGWGAGPPPGGIHPAAEPEPEQPATETKPTKTTGGGAAKKEQTSA